MNLEDVGGSEITAFMAPKMMEDWASFAWGLQLDAAAVINGKSVTSDATREIISPIDGRKLANSYELDEAHVDAAVRGAHDAFEKGAWSRIPGVERKRIMLHFADLMDRDRAELAALESINSGKTLHVAYEKDLVKAINAVRWYAEWIDKLTDEVPYTRPNAIAFVRRKPIGVVATLTPWNYPLYLGVLKLAPALALGNSVIMKPSELTPLSTIKLARLALEAGIPEGVFNVVTGDGLSVGSTLVSHPLVNAIAFTGSTATGGRIMELAGRTTLKKVQLECGGKSAQVVLDDVGDLDAAASGIVSGIFYNQGQVCNAGSRLIVTNKIKDELLKRVLEVAEREYVPGNPLEPSVKFGPLISQEHMNRVLGYVDSGISDGATPILGGKQTLMETGGFYVEPTVMDNVTNGMKIAQEEIFGPVLSVITASDTEEAVRLANDSDFALAASIWTADVSVAHKVSAELKAGVVWVNSYNVSEITIPFGGMKQSGFGRDKSVHAFENYSELKTTWIEL